MWSRGWIYPGQYLLTTTSQTSDSNLSHPSILHCGDIFTNLTCTCSPGYRAAAAACEKITCTPKEYEISQAGGDHLCALIAESPQAKNGSVTVGNPASVSAAIASATSVAAAAVAGKNVTNLYDYPLCAQDCIKPINPDSGCESLNNRTCRCHGDVSETIGRCELSNCNKADTTTLYYLVYQYCNAPGVGGLGDTGVIISSVTATQTPAGRRRPTPVAGTGTAAGGRE